MSETQTLTISEFLKARLDEDESAAKACAEVYPPPWDVSDRGWMAKVTADQPDFRTILELEQHPAIEGWLSARLDHIARHDPDRVLEDIMSKLAIVDLHRLGDLGDPSKIGCTICLEDYSWGPELVEGPCATLRLLAAPYRKHPDYRDEWS